MICVGLNILLPHIVNRKKVSPESERYEECLFGYSGIVHTDMYVLSPSCLAMGINLVRDKGPRD